VPPVPIADAGAAIPAFGRRGHPLSRHRPGSSRHSQIRRRRRRASHWRPAARDRCCGLGDRLRVPHRLRKRLSRQDRREHPDPEETGWLILACGVGSSERLATRTSGERRPGRSSLWARVPRLRPPTPTLACVWTSAWGTGLKPLHGYTAVALGTAVEPATVAAMRIACRGGRPVVQCAWPL